MTIRFPGVNIGNMHLDHRSGNSPDSIGKSNGRMGISAGIENDTDRRKSALMDFVYQLALDIRLVIMYRMERIAGTQLFEIAFERSVSVNAFFTFSQQIQVRAVNNPYIHKSKDFVSLSLPKTPVKRKNRSNKIFGKSTKRLRNISQ